MTFFFIITTSIFKECNIRKEQYIKGINKLKEIIKNINIKNYKIIIVENNGFRKTYLDNLLTNCEIYYTNNNFLNVGNGYKELSDIFDTIKFYNIQDSDFIIKMTGRYILEDNSEFMNEIKKLEACGPEACGPEACGPEENMKAPENIVNYDCIIKYGSFNKPVNYKTEDCISGLIGMRCIYVKQIKFPKLNECVEWNWAKTTYLIDNKKIYIANILGINICPGNNKYFLI
jgi:hypothetical protein